MNPYRKEYRWADLFAMVRNLSKDAEICPDDFRDRTVVITGATSGIGLAAARKFASQGANLVLVNRNEKKSVELCESLRTEYHTACEYLLADFSSLSDIHVAAQRLSNLERNIDVLIHNAGVYITQKTFTQDGIESVFQTNYLSTFIITHTIREKLKKQNSGRILYVNSEAHRFAWLGLYLDDLRWDEHRYSGLMSYGSAKMAQLLSMLKYAEYFQDTGVTINAMHPGNVRTNSGQNNSQAYKFFKRILVDQTARPIDLPTEAIYYLCVSKNVAAMSGKFFNLTTEETPAPPALDKAAAERLWNISLKMSGLHEN